MPIAEGYNNKDFISIFWGRLLESLLSIWSLSRNIQAYCKYKKRISKHKKSGRHLDNHILDRKTNLVLCGQISKSKKYNIKFFLHNFAFIKTLDTSQSNEREYQLQGKNLCRQMYIFHMILQKTSELDSIFFRNSKIKLHVIYTFFSFFLRTLFVSEN